MGPVLYAGLVVVFFIRIMQSGTNNPAMVFVGPFAGALVVWIWLYPALKALGLS